jgi:hypothetical protein
MVKLPIKANAASFEHHVSWLPGMAMVKLSVKWEYKEIADGDALEVMSGQIDRFERYSLECCLREIAECSIERKVLPGGDSKRSLMRMGMGDDTVEMTLHVGGVSMQDVLGTGSELNIVDVDKLEMIVRGSMWKLIHSESETPSSVCGEGM